MLLFYSYCHEDEGFRQDMETHLSVLRQSGEITEWYDRKIVPGQEIENEIEANLSCADIIALFISSDFLTSTACTNEMDRALELCDNRGAIVVPIIVRPCDWQNSLIAHLLALPTDGKPVAIWANRDEAFLDIVAGIRRVIEGNHLRVRSEYRSELTKIEFISQNKSDLNMEDLFIFPNIVRIQEDEEIPIESLDQVFAHGKRIVLRGDDRSGKSMICRKMFIDRTDEDRPVIMLSGTDLVATVRHEAVISRVYQTEFAGTFERWLQLEDKLLIIDDLVPGSELSFVKYARDHFGSILITVSDDAYVSYFRDERELADFTMAAIRPLQHTQQEVLIKQWLNLDPRVAAAKISDGFVDQLENRLNAIILNHRIVPRYPFYVLSILQAYEAFMPQGMQITAYGHCYQALITAQMIRAGVQGDDIDSGFNLLAHVAFRLFREQRHGEGYTVDQFLRQYRAMFVVRDGVVSRLTTGEKAILARDGAMFRFRYPYVYYYFLGYYFARNKEESESDIDDIARASYVRDNAFILIFAVHHAHDDLVSRIMDHTMTAFKETAVAKLSTEETKILESALFELPEHVLSGQSVTSARRAQRQSRDRVEENQNLEGEKPKADESPSLNEAYRMLKNMDILGQIVRNKYGSLKIQEMEDIITTIADAGLRLVHIITSERGIRSFDEFVAERARILRSDKVVRVRGRPTSDEKVLRAQLRRQFRALVIVTVYMILKKTAVTIGKAELRSVVERVVKAKGTAAYKALGTFFALGTANTVDMNLVNHIVAALDTQHKERNRVVRRLISLETQFYLNTHRVKHKLRQRLYESLGVPYKPNN